MTYFVGTDAHLNYNEPLPQQVRRFVKAARDSGAKVCFAGDTFNILPSGMKKWRPDTEVVRELLEILEPGDEFVAGNHDPLSNLDRLLAGSGFEPKPRLETEVGGRTWMFRHGHERSDWFIWRFFASRVVEYMVEHHGALWYRLCEKLGWLPGREKKRRPYQETHRYTLMTRGVQSAWETYGESKRLSMVIGHTHKAKTSTTWLADWTEVRFLDAGDLRDRSYAVVTPDESYVTRLEPTD
jgi:UDP-2,3-diacylglucosamine pyrophosphatase LpxH